MKARLWKAQSGRNSYLSMFKSDIELVHSLYCGAPGCKDFFCGGPPHAWRPHATCSACGEDRGGGAAVEGAAGAK